MSFLLFLSMLLLENLYANDYDSDPAMKSFTETGTGTNPGPSINYYNEYITGGNTNYTNGQFQVTLYSYTSMGGKLELKFLIKKSSGYFKQGNSGKIFAVDEAYGNTYGSSFYIANSTTSALWHTVSIDDFTDTRPFSFYLITSDQQYKQYGGTIRIICTSNTLPPTIITREATSISTTTATLKGVIRPNGKTTSYTFSYGTNKYNLTEIYTE